MKVLLAEDSLMERRRLSVQLARWGYEVCETEDGQDAWQHFQETHFPLVVTDWIMPEVDGLELIRRIRASADSRYVYIILLTGRSDNENVVEDMVAGAEDFLIKPCHPKELKVRLTAGARIIELEQRLIGQNRQLRETQAALVQSEKLAGVGQLAAGMAHEINNPVAFVSNNIAVLQRDVQQLLKLVDEYHRSVPIAEQHDPELADRIRTLENECDLPWLKDNLPRLFESSSEGLSRVRGIVSNLRDFAHLDEADVDTMDVVAALELTLDVLAADLTAKELVIVRKYAGQPMCHCWPAKIKQVLHGILLNAIQASEHGGTIVVSAQENDNDISVTVSDTGSGMDETTQQRLFEPFYTTHPVGAGQGMGLAVCYGIVQQHGGSIEFESAVGVGTTLTVRLPKSQKAF